jgi:MtrB/PioB family decaheme-associated outer membrane protein
MPELRTRPLRNRARALLLGLAALAVFPGPAAAQDEGFDLEEDAGFEVEQSPGGDEQATRELTKPESRADLGFFYNTSNDEIFGNYGGFLDEGFALLGNVDLWQRDPYGWGDDYSVRLRGLNLGLDSRFVGLDLRRQGRYSLFFEYDQLPVFRSETTATFFNDVGRSSLTLPRPWTPGNNGAQMTNLPANQRRYDSAWDRKRFTGGSTLEFTDTLGFDLRYDYELKKGKRLTSAMMGLTGGNPRSVLVPEPLDYQTQQIEATFRHVGEDLQLSLGYYGSGFDNDDRFFRFENAYLPQATWDPASGFDCTDGVAVPATSPGCGMGQKATAPDNWFHQILASGGYDLPRRTRVTLSTAFGWMLQDQDFLPYSINSALTATTPGGAATNGADRNALPRDSLDGEIFTTVVDFRVSSKPLENVDLGAGYHLDKRDNRTPRDIYVRIRGDAEDQDPSLLDSPQARSNLPYSFTQHRVDLDAGYRVWNRTNLTFGYEWERSERDFQERDELTENTLGAMLTSQPFSFLGGRVSYAHAWRNGDAYDGNGPFRRSHAPSIVADDDADCLASGLIPPNACPFENHPLLRKSYLANRERDEVKLSLQLAPLENLSFSPWASYRIEDYDNSEVGITSVRNFGSGIDVGYTPFARLSTHAFYAYQNYRTEQNGWSFQANANLYTQVNDSNRKWKSTSEDRIHSFGAGFDLAVLPGRLAFASDYLYTTAVGDIGLSVGSALAAGAPYPNSKSKQHTVSARADYRFTENISMQLGYLFAYAPQDDWAVDGLTPTSLSCNANSCVIGSGRESEGYTAHVVSAALSYRFW